MTLDELIKKIWDIEDRINASPNPDAGKGKLGKELDRLLVEESKFHTGGPDAITSPQGRGKLNEKKKNVQFKGRS